MHEIVLLKNLTLHIFERKYFIVMHYYVLLFILLDSFLSVNALPVSSNSNENYGRDIRGTLIKGQNSDSELKIEADSTDYLSSVEAYPKEENEGEMNYPDETPKERRIYLMEGQTSTAIPLTTEKRKSSLLIYPGTKWCGAGDIANDYDDLGTEEETDKCCRMHDACEDYILGKETKFNLTNNSAYPRLSCNCDEQLYECLRQANTPASNAVGALYFNLFSWKCFTFDHPKKCIKYVTPFKVCAEYELDTLSEKIYQWSSNKKYEAL